MSEQEFAEANKNKDIMESALQQEILSQVEEMSGDDADSESDNEFAEEEDSEDESEWFKDKC